MAELNNGLVQMNSRMVMTDTAANVTALGVLIAVICLLVALVGWLDGKRRWWIFGIAAVLFAAMAVYGSRSPRIREIRACAVEPVSLERVAATYDIMEVNGKEIVLRER